MRLRKIKNAKEKLEQFSSIIVFEPTAYKGRWNEAFGNDNPIFLEIGMGKGKFITENASKNPDINYIGIELSESIILKAARNIENLQLKNLKFLNINANTLFEVFDEEEISKIFLNFSDPWPKSRHAKRRLTSEEFITIYKVILKKLGIIEMKTDNQNLFEYSIIKFNEFGFKFLEVSLNLHKEQDGNIITTEYEERFKSLNQTIYYIKVEL